MSAAVFRASVCLFVGSHGGFTSSHTNPLRRRREGSRQGTMGRKPSKRSSGPPNNHLLSVTTDYYRFSTPRASCKNCAQHRISAQGAVIDSQPSAALTHTVSLTQNTNYRRGTYSSTLGFSSKCCYEDEQHEVGRDWFSPLQIICTVIVSIFRNGREGLAVFVFRH